MPQNENMENLSDEKRPIQGKTVLLGSTLKAERNIQIGDKYINLYNTSPSIPHNLTVLPPFPEKFIGRVDEVKKLRGMLAGGSIRTPLFISGNGGLGKTTLASKYFHEYRTEYKHVGWIFGGEGIASALINLAKSLDLQFDTTLKTQERLEILLKYLADLPGPSLLVIDNVDSLEEITNQYLNLSALSNFNIIITTRITNFGWGNFLNLGGLFEEECLELFESHYKKLDQAELQLFNKILESVERNTLLIELMAKNLASINLLRPKYAIGDLLKDLTHKGLFGVSLPESITIGYHSELGKLRIVKAVDILEAMYDLSEISKSSLILLSIFSILPPIAIPFNILEKLITNLPDLEEAIINLSKTGWIEFNQKETTFRCNMLVQEVVRKKNPGIQADCENFLENLLNLLQFETRTGHFDHISYEEAFLLVQFVESIASKFNKLDEKLIDLYQNAGIFNLGIGNLERSLYFFELVEKSYEEFSNEKNSSQARAFLHGLNYKYFGNAHVSLGNLSVGLGYYRKGLEFFKRLHQHDPTNIGYKLELGIAYAKLSEVFERLGEMEHSWMYTIQFNNIMEELYRDNAENSEIIHSLAISLQYLGNYHNENARVEQAIVCYERFLELMEELCETYTGKADFLYGSAMAYYKLGETSLSKGDSQEALDYFEESKEIFSKLFNKSTRNVLFKHALSVIYEKLGNLFIYFENLQQAKIYFEYDMVLSSELKAIKPPNVNYFHGYANCFYSLGIIKVKETGIEEGLPYFKRYYELAEDMVANFPENIDSLQVFNFACHNLGQAYVELNDFENVEYYFEKSRIYLQKLLEDYPDNPSYKEQLSLTFSNLGDAQQNLGNFDNALSNYQKYYWLQKELTEAYPGRTMFKDGYGIACAKLAILWGYTFKNKENSLVYFQEALNIFQELRNYSPEFVRFYKLYELLSKDLTHMEVNWSSPSGMVYYYKSNDEGEKYTFQLPQN